MERGAKGMDMKISKIATLLLIGLCLALPALAQESAADITGTWYNGAMRARLTLEPDGTFRLEKRGRQVSGAFAFDGEDIRLETQGPARAGWVGASGGLLFYDYPGDFTRVEMDRLDCVQYMLLMKDAILALAPHTVLEPSSPPYNLGGWRSGDVVSFPLAVEAAGYYGVELTYAREGEEAIDVRIESDGGEFLEAGLEATGTWTRYAQVVVGTVWLTPDDKELTITDARPVSEWRYVVNLRAVRLTAAQTQAP
jgi:hypothetical protein